jgi:hypothetical protein
MRTWGHGGMGKLPDEPPALRPMPLCPYFPMSLCPFLGLDPQFSQLAGERIPVEPELGGGLRQMAVGLVEYAADEAALELAAPVLEADAAVHHLVDEPPEQFSHASSPG